MTKLSVIIPTYNKADVLVVTLQALTRQTLEDFEVCIVDDGSTDEVASLIESLSASFSPVFLTQQNQGAAVARNSGVHHTSGEIILFLDADIVLRQDALASHLAAHRASESSIFVGRVLPPTSSLYGKEDLYFQESFDLGPDARELSPGNVLTQCLSIRRSDFQRIGGFDPYLRRGQDLDFGVRALKTGLSLRYLPSSVGWHNHALSLKTRCNVEQRNHRELVSVYLKHPELASQVVYLQDKWPIDWKQDSFSLKVRKTLRRIQASRPVRYLLGWTWAVVGKSPLPDSLLRWTYWKIVSAHQSIGVREGLRIHHN